MDQAERTRLETYLRKLLGASALAVAAGAKDGAELRLGAQKIADITKDEEDGELSYYLTVSVELDPASTVKPKDVILDAPERARTEKILRERLGAPKLSVRPRPRKTDSAEVYVGDEFIGTLSKDEEGGKVGYFLTASILEIDLDEGQ